MDSRTTRRRCLGGLALAALPALAGCLGSDDGSGDGGGGAATDTPTDTPTDATTTDRPTTTEEQTTTDDESPPGDSPAELLRAYVEAGTEDPTTVRPYFHPVHPLHPDNLSAEDAEQFLTRDTDAEVTGVTVERRDRTVTATAVLESPLMRLGDPEQSAVADALADGKTAVLELTIARADGTEARYRVATATTGGKWRILALALPPAEPDAPDEAPSDFEGRVVGEVTYHTDPHAARAHFDRTPTAAELTVRSLSKDNVTSSTTPDVIDYLGVRIDPAGDEVVVSATVDGDARPIHRERYPPAERTVADVTYDGDPASDAFDAQARVQVRDVGDDERVAAASTVYGNRVELDPSFDSGTLVLGMAPEGDEVVVTRSADGTTEEIHRERHVF